jgi:uncharacterized Zn finger protein (UPF0148 family)
MSGCSAVTAGGEPCKGSPKAGTAFCPAHDPNRAQARRESASKAAKAKAVPPSAEIQEIKAKLRKLAGDVLAGNVSRADASVVAQITGVWLRASEVELKLREIEEVIPRLEQIEARVKADSGRTAVVGTANGGGRTWQA